MSDTYVARRTFQYGELSLDRGEVFELSGMLNDDKLVRLGFCMELPKRQQKHTAQCGKCGKRFIADGELNAHGRLRHGQRPSADPNEDDARAERLEKLENEIAPLYLDKTAASNGYSVGRAAHV